MQVKNEYLVPDYYPLFRCKINACRNVCCDGWPVTISMKDYFRLVGVICSPELRRRLDAALHILPHPSEEEYAQICPRYDGTCPVRMEDGRCQIQAELGEEALSLVCRQFPRGVRIQDYPECSCANSCEAVVEMFLDHKEPLQFIRMPLCFELPAVKERSYNFATADRGQKIRMYYIRIMQIRELELPERLMTLGIALQKVEQALKTDDPAMIDQIISSKSEYFTQKIETPTQDQFDAGMKIAGFMLKQVDERSQSVRDFGEAALEWFARAGNSIDRYQTAVSNFENIIPDWQIVFEHLLVNHMFFEQFPFQDRPVPVSDEFFAICAVYTLLRFLSVGWTAMHPTVTDFVDVCAALFRLISHTAFDRFAAGLLKQTGCSTPEKVYALVRL